MVSKKVPGLVVLFLLFSVVVSYGADNQTYNMTGRLGIGANMSLSGGMGLSGRYWLNDVTAVEAIFNFTSMDAEGSAGDSHYFVLAGRGMYSLFDYSNVHGCVGGGIALGNMEISENDENFFGLEGFFLIEYMLNEFFSISGQTGFTYINADDASVISIGTPFTIGMFGFHFYF